MGKEISLIAFLDEVVSRNTQHYRKDFELDAQKLRDALNSPYMDERIFYFMSRPNGTWCVLERDVFLRDSDGYKIWTHYADMPDGIEAYRVTITGRRGTAPMGHVVKLNYREQVQRVIKVAIPFDDVELTFYSGEKFRMPMEQYRNFAAAPKARRNCTALFRWNIACKRAGSPKQKRGRTLRPDRRC
jgi:hypothetical protein